VDNSSDAAFAREFIDNNLATTREVEQIHDLGDIDDRYPKPAAARQGGATYAPEGERGEEPGAEGEIARRRSGGKDVGEAGSEKAGEEMMKPAKPSSRYI